jgi:hypothetical protein
VRRQSFKFSKKLFLVVITVPPKRETRIISSVLFSRVETQKQTSADTGAGVRLEKKSEPLQNTVIAEAMGAG